MKPTINKIAVYTTVGMTALAMILRLTTLPQVQQEAVGEFGVSFWLLVALCAAAIVLAVLAFLSDLPLHPVGGEQQPKLGGLSVAVGVVLLLDTALALVRFGMLGKTPPPNAQILNNADKITLYLTFAFGLLGGLWLVVLGCQWLRRQTLGNLARAGALLPVLWIWCRLARYELSYASAANIKRSFYDFFMLLFLMLFLLAFARWVADVAPPSAKTMRALSAIAAMAGISSPLTRLGMQMLGDTEAFNASQLAGITDLAIGALALAVTVYLFRDRLDFVPVTVERAPLLEELKDADEEEDLGQVILHGQEAPSATPVADKLIAELLEEENTPRLFMLDDPDDQ